MTSLTNTDTAEIAAVPAERSRRPGRRTLAGWAAAFAAAWLLPVAAHAVHADLLSIVVVWLGIAALVRAGHLLLDRLVFSGILLAGYFLAGGLLFSVWPWGLQPVPVAGVSLTLVVLGALVTGRRPELPIRIVPTDALILGSGALSWHYMHGPLAHGSFSKNLRYTAAREDMFNQYDIFDAIHRIGGYTYLHTSASRPFMSDPYTYPSGTHFLYAVFDIFLRSTTDPGDSLDEYSRYVDYSLLTMALLTMAIVWAARWVAGAGLAGWRRGFICAVVGCLAASGQLTTLWWQGFVAESMGLATVAVAAAVLIRPARRVRDQVLLTAAVVIAAAFTYTLTGVLVFGMTVVSVAVYHRRLLRHWRFALLVGVPAVAVAAVPYLVPMAHGFSASGQFLVSGISVKFSRTMWVGIALLSLSSLATRTGRRSPVLWANALCVATVLAATVAMGYYSHLHGANDVGQGYYYEKLVEASWVVALVGFGAVGMLLKPGATIGTATKNRRRLADGLASTVAVAAVLVATGVVRTGPAHMANFHPTPDDVTWGAGWASGDLISPESVPIAEAVGHGLVGGSSRPTILIYSDSGHDNRHVSMFIGSVDHNRNVVGDGTYEFLQHSDGLATYAPPKKKGATLSANLQASLGNFDEMLRRSPVPLTVVVWNPNLAQHLRDLAAAEPRIGVTVVLL